MGPSLHVLGKKEIQLIKMFMENIYKIITGPIISEQKYIFHDLVFLRKIPYFVMIIFILNMF